MPHIHTHTHTHTHMYVCVCVCVSVGCIQLNAHPDAPAAARISRRSHQHCAAADEQGDETKCASPSKQEDICRKALTCTGIRLIFE